VTRQIRRRITPRTATRSTSPRRVVMTREDLRDARGHLPCHPEIEELVRPVRIRAGTHAPCDEELRPGEAPVQYAHERDGSADAPIHRRPAEVLVVTTGEGPFYKTIRHSDTAYKSLGRLTLRQ
jgi:hypothetical protein